MNHDLAANKGNALAFYKAPFEGAARETVRKYVGAEYIQQKPLVGNGPEPFVEYFERMAAEYSAKSPEFVGSVAERNLVALHQARPGGNECVKMDFFPFDEYGKIVKHWDSMQQIPKTSANENTMY